MNTPKDFKLLAIRPLEGTSSKLLKGLKKNQIYSLYNEYSYVLDEKTKELTSIEYVQSVPSNLYGKNISFSAIVGKNGSGKSSLLELFYYATLLISNEYLDKKAEEVMKENLNIEIIILKDEAIKILTIKDDLVTSKILNKELNEKQVVFKECDNVLQIALNKSIDFNFYTNVLNYSIYGLNSNLMPWIDLIFYKNDAYQLPIVINPFKDYGNYDINKEYLLMQSRAVFYSYVLEVKEIIEGIYIHNINFEININKILKIDNSKSTYSQLQQFFSLNLAEKEFNKLVFKGIDINKIISLQNISKYIGEEVGENSTVFYRADLKEVNLYKSFTYLYIFKKIYKISKTYKKYKKYHFLFSDQLPFNFAFNILKAIESSMLEIKDSLPDIKNREIVYDKLMLHLDLVSNDNSDITEDDLFYIKDLFMHYYEVRHDIKNKIEDHLLDISFEYDNITDNIELVCILIQKLFNGKEFREYLFEDYIKEINKDTSHITFKLKQAINYFSLDIFNSIEVDSTSIVVDNESDCKIKLSIERDYFKDRKKIEDIPLAIFNHVIEVVKSKEDDENIRRELISNNKLKPYPYTSLSSGEQHMINSILTIAYHNYNLLSVADRSNLIKYKNINLIFDELELYLHPEYQRNYILNLIKVLNKIKDITKQTDILDILMKSGQLVKQLY
ncbi:hypothetical protein [Myroides injenensis]|uniref:hypothetical protein n=1 Tax=Myroides injenensis TaxID=1183151 RepID=UPI000287E818|nr:hypothetical protein [Myroides injenensis]